MITTPKQINTFFDIRECVKFYDIKPINPDRWNEIDGYDTLQEYYDDYHPNVLFLDFETDIYELELGKLENRTFLVFEGEQVYDAQTTIHVVELEMPNK